VLVALKDQHDLEGLPTRAGSPHRRAPASRDGDMVRRLEAAGLVIPGKTHCTEWGMCPAGRSPSWELPRNPHDPTRVAGGSSTGAAVAVSLGLCPVAVGSDAGGSVRIPAALQGLFALLPIPEPPSKGDLFGRGSLTVNGPIARSVTDLVELMAVMRGGDPGPSRHALGRGLRGCRVGVPDTVWSAATRGVSRRGEALLSALAAEGAVLVPIGGAEVLEARQLGAWLALEESARGLATEAAAGQLHPDLHALLMHPRPDPSVLSAGRDALRRWLGGVFEGVDLLALPSTLAPAPRYMEGGALPYLNERDNRALCGPCFLANLCGAAAGSLPAGAVDGLPVGLQLVGPRGRDVLAAMAHAERSGLCSAQVPTRRR
jgi:aspartyl-tRNA(Asn)/glutamyl-tRNA(Gln) amidotransferase subunit A